MFSPAKLGSRKEKTGLIHRRTSSSSSSRPTTHTRVDDLDQIKPLLLSDFPQPVRDRPISSGVSGGIDIDTCLSWLISGDELFVWSYLSSASKNCVTLTIPPTHYTTATNTWLLSLLNWNPNTSSTTLKQCGILLCNHNTGALIYWPDIYSSAVLTYSPTPPHTFQPNSFITSPIPNSRHTCIALASSSSGELWQFHCSPTGVQQGDVLRFSDQVYGYPRSLIWGVLRASLDESYRQFFLLTNHEILCFALKLSPTINVSKLWSHEIVSIDGDLGIKKDLAGQKRIWPLHIQTDGQGKEFTLLVATFCKDRATSSSYTEYSLLTMQFKSGINILSVANSQTHGNVLEKKAPVQVIIPKARAEEEELLFSMRLRVGGKPSGSAIILAADGTATVSHYHRNAAKLYKFDLPYDAGKVLDASVFFSAEGGEDGAWVVLTEKAGLWAIPEQSLSRQEISNDGSSQEERRNLTFEGIVSPKRAGSNAWDDGDNRHKAALPGTTREMAQDEESETLLGQIFNDFLQSGQVDGSLEKLQNAGAFERDGETNIFARTSKSIVDTLAKHWTTTRGAEIVSMSIVSTQLMDKQHKHKQFLQFLALSKCHEELCSRQRKSLQIIMEHGEKLAGMIQLRELQNMINQNRSVSTPYSSSESEMSGSLWDLIQLVGERARRNTVLLMDRDNAEVFYSKVSNIEEVFSCLDRELEYLINAESPLTVQIIRSYELSNACRTLVRTAMQYRNMHHIWYPSPEGLAPWYCLSVVRNGIWKITSFMLQLVKETTATDMSTKSKLYSILEVLVEVLLDSYNGAIRAKVDRGEDHSSLLQEYRSRKDALFGALYEQVKSLAEAKCQELNEEVEMQNGEILEKLSSGLLSIAKQHEGYQTMWNICCDLNDSILLRKLMHGSMGTKGGFSYYVFTQMYERRQFAKLLRLGEEFQEELSTFIKQHSHLSWLHQVYLHQFTSASDTLHSLAVTQDDNDNSIMEDGNAPTISKPEQTVTERKRFLNLSKIAAVAGKDAVYETKVKRIEADLKLLKLQEEIIQSSYDNEQKQNNGQRLLSPEDLIKLCLKDKTPDLSLQAFEVFAWTDASFRECNKALLEKCWKNAADQDEWGKLHEASIAEGWSDEDTLRALRETILFQASSRCYGPETETYEGGEFDKVLPLRQDDSNNSDSVESILMQHKNYSDAGKLMLTAIMLGSVQPDFVVEEDPSSPME